MDYPTEVVYDWLKFFKVKCARINGSDLINKGNISIRFENEAGLQFDYPDLDISKVKAVWMRRWMNSYEYKALHLRNIEPKNNEDGEGDVFKHLYDDINHFLKDEFKGLSHYFFQLLKDKPSLGHSFYSGRNPSKSEQLSVAKNCGLHIPDTLITTSKKELTKFFSSHHKIITKCIYEAGFLQFKGSYGAYTAIVTEEILNCLPGTFFPSLFQEFLQKEFEIRTFFLNNKTYSMAIFSANDKQTEVDFRRYNEVKPNRNVPFQLPHDVDEKIKRFMHECRLDTGSLDLIYTKTGQYVFLEVNPGGQFGMVSSPCNYNLEKIVAEYLIKLSRNEE